MRFYNISNIKINKRCEFFEPSSLFFRKKTKSHGKLDIMEGFAHNLLTFTIFFDKILKNGGWYVFR